MGRLVTFPLQTDASDQLKLDWTGPILPSHREAAVLMHSQVVEV